MSARAARAPVVALVALALALVAPASLPGVHGACTPCRIPLCGLDVQLGPADTCSVFAQASLLPTIAVGGATSACANQTRTTLCAYFLQQSAAREANGCSTSGGAIMCTSDCARISNCLLVPSLYNCGAPTNADPNPSTCLVVNDTYYTARQSQAAPAAPAVIEPLPCPTLEQQETGVDGDAALMRSVELGAVAPYADGSDPSFPAIQLVYLPHKRFADIFPAHCNDVRVFDWRPWGVTFAYVPLCIVCLSLFLWRSNRQPLKARGKFLIVIQVPLTLGGMVLTSILDSWGYTAVCWAGMIEAFLLFPLFAWCSIARVSQLVFVHGWNTLKSSKSITPQELERSFFYRYRWLLTWKGELALFALGALPGVILVIVFSVMYADTIGWNDTVLGAARCEWWDFNADVVAAAAAKGIDVYAPTAANPNGYAPYSVHYASCSYCGWAFSSTFTATTLSLNVTYLVLVGLCLLWIRKIHDQYHIWREMCFTCAWLMCTMAVPAASADQQTRKKFKLSNGLQVDAFFLFAGMAGWCLLCLLYPTLMTWRKENDLIFRREQRRADNDDGETKHKSQFHSAGHDTSNDTLERLKSTPGSAGQSRVDGGGAGGGGGGGGRTNSALGPADTLHLRIPTHGGSSGLMTPTSPTGAHSGGVFHAFRSEPASPHGGVHGLSTTSGAAGSGSVGSPLPQISFDQVLTNPVALAGFRQFCIEHFDVENLMFYLDCIEYRKVDIADRYEPGLQLYQKYVVAGSPMELNLGFTERAELAALYDPAKGGGRAKLEAWYSAQAAAAATELALQAAATAALTPAAAAVVEQNKAKRGNNKAQRRASGKRRTEFDTARHGIFRLLMTNSWPRFQTSALYRSVAEAVRAAAVQNPNTGRRNNARDKPPAAVAAAAAVASSNGSGNGPAAGPAASGHAPHGLGSAVALESSAAGAVSVALVAPTSAYGGGYSGTGTGTGTGPSSGGSLLSPATASGVHLMSGPSPTLASSANSTHSHHSAGAGGGVFELNSAAPVHLPPSAAAAPPPPSSASPYRVSTPGAVEMSAAALTFAPPGSASASSASSASTAAVFGATGATGAATSAAGSLPVSHGNGGAATAAAAARTGSTPPTPLKTAPPSAKADVEHLPNSIP